MYQPASGQFAISSNGAERLRLDGSGNFGIGTAAPTSKLHVVGSARVTGDMTVDGNIAARYQDVAEALDRALRHGFQPRYGFFGARLKSAQDVLQRRIIIATLQLQGRIISCHAGRLNLVLDESGELYPCEEFALRLGNVRDHEFDVRATARSAQARAVLATIQRGECWCTHECYMMTNILFSLRQYPALLAEYLRLPPSNRS